MRIFRREQLVAEQVPSAEDAGEEVVDQPGDLGGAGVKAK
jgi:hypothetical protein